MVKVLLQRGRLIDFRDVVWLCPAFLGFSRHSEIIGRKLEPEFARGFRFCDMDLSGQLFQKQHCSGSPPGPGFRSPPLQIVPCQHIVVAAKAVPLVCAVTSARVYSSCCRAVLHRTAARARLVLRACAGMPAEEGCSCFGLMPVCACQEAVTCSLLHDCSCLLDWQACIDEGVVLMPAVSNKVAPPCHGPAANMAVVVALVPVLVPAVAKVDCACHHTALEPMPLVKARHFPAVDGGCHGCHAVLCHVAGRHA